MKIKSTLALVSLLLTGAPMVSHAMTLNCGPNICYQYDETQAAAALFGQPTLIGDSMRFLPPNFRTESNNILGLPLTTTASANFIFNQVWAITPGAEIGTVQVTETGDYNISGDTGGNPDTVGVSLWTMVANNASTEVVNNIVNFSATGNSAGTQIWTLQGNSINPAIAFAASAHNVAIGVQNTLTATTDELGGDAWIQKKFTVIVGTDVPPPVPLPPALPLMLSGLGLLGAGIRRRRRI